MKKVIMLILILATHVHFSLPVMASTTSFSEWGIKPGNSSKLMMKDDFRLPFVVNDNPYRSAFLDNKKLAEDIRGRTDRPEIPFTLPALNFELPPVIDEVSHIGKAFIANFAVHELGHIIMANHVDAAGTRLHLLENHNGSFFLGRSTYEEIDDESKLSFSIAGEIAVDQTFEYTLGNYRKNPTIYNKSLLFFSGTDFLWYCFYAFYISDGNPHLDPIAIAEETGMSKEKIITIALAKTMINAYRVYSGKDWVIPYFSANKNKAMINFKLYF